MRGDRPGALEALGRDGLRVHAVAEDQQPDVFRRYRVPGTPYVAYLEDGVVAAKGLVNTLEQIEELIATGRERRVPSLSARLTAEPGRCRGGSASGTTRRSFLAGVASVVLAAIGARPRDAGAATVLPGANRIRGGWYGFCGHYFTTGSCPSPYTLPRVDARGFPCARPTGGRSTTSAGRSTSPGPPGGQGGGAACSRPTAPRCRARRARGCARTRCRSASASTP